MNPAGLRIDVDTYRGTREGVPRLLDRLDEQGVKGSFFFSVGPDNMGRHLWRLVKPSFLWKMLRSRAASLYGWEILLAGTAWPGKPIGRELGHLMRRTLDRGHEVGLHAWDHHAWQAHAGHWDVDRLGREFARGLRALEDILGAAVECSAVAGWRADARVVEAKERFGLRYHSDCRGYEIFRPWLPGATPGTPQIPVSLPTYDERVGGDLDAGAFTELILARLGRPGLNVYTVHAEVEGILLDGEFRRLLAGAAARNIEFVPLGRLLPANPLVIPPGELRRGHIDGREGWVGVQA